MRMSAGSVSILIWHSLTPDLNFIISGLTLLAHTAWLVAPIVRKLQYQALNWCLGSRLSEPIRITYGARCTTLSLNNHRLLGLSH